MRILSDEAISILLYKAEEKYEDVEMTNIEWEEKLYLIIAQAQLKDAQEQVKTSIHDIEFKSDSAVEFMNGVLDFLKELE